MDLESCRAANPTNIIYVSSEAMVEKHEGNNECMHYFIFSFVGAKHNMYCIEHPWNSGHTERLFVLRPSRAYSLPILHRRPPASDFLFRSWFMCKRFYRLATSILLQTPKDISPMTNSQTKLFEIRSRKLPQVKPVIDCNFCFRRAPNGF